MKKPLFSFIKKGLIALSVVILTLVIAFFGLKNYFFDNVLFLPHSTTARTESVKVVLGNEVLWVPANYFTSGYPETSEEDHTALLHTYWPHMNGTTKETEALEERVPGFGNRMIILLIGNLPKERPSSYYSLLQSIVTKITPFDNYTLHGKRYDLHFFKNYPERVNDDFYDIYVDDLKNPQTFIRCVADDVKKDQSRSPWCAQQFLYKTVDYKVTYSREFQPQWLEIQTKVKNLVDGFRKHPSSRSPKGE